MTDQIINQLRELYNRGGDKSPERGFFDLLAARTNRQNVTKVDRMLGLLLSNGYEANRQNVVRVMQQLDEMNLGRFLVGRRGKPSRMEWTVDIVAAARAATGQAESLDMTPISPEDDEDEADADLLEHRFHLRPDFAVSIELPVDFTEEEAKRLSTFIQSLPLK